MRGRHRRRPGTPAAATLLLSLALMVLALASLWPQFKCSLPSPPPQQPPVGGVQTQDDPFAADGSLGADTSSAALSFQMPDYVIDDLADGDQLYSGFGLGLDSAAEGQRAASPFEAATNHNPAGQSSSSSPMGKRSLTRRHLQVYAGSLADSSEPQQATEWPYDDNRPANPSFAAPFKAATPANYGASASVASYPLANFYFDQPQQQTRHMGGQLSSSLHHSFASNGVVGHMKTSTNASPSMSSSGTSLNNRIGQQQFAAEDRIELEQHEARLLQQNQNKIGPQFVKEPPSFIHYLNSSDLIIPCAASGNPAPVITWWQKSQQLKLGSLLDKRYVRYDNALVISAFKTHEFEPDIHSASYRCQASNPLGTIISRDVVINAVIDQEYEANVADQFVTVDNDALFKCQLPPQVRDIYQVIGWLEDGQQLVASSPVGPVYGSLFAAATTTIATNGKETRRRQQQQQQQQQPQRAIMLPSGHLYIQRVQLRDANKSYKCQIKNLLSGRLSSSTISGRLFVTDANESGASPRIIDGPGPVAAGRLGDPLLLGCLAQGSPRPTVRWFRWMRTGQQRATSREQRDNDNLITTADQDSEIASAADGQWAWVELLAAVQQQPSMPSATQHYQLASNSSNASSGQQQQQTTGGQAVGSAAVGANQTADSTRYLLSSEGNFLLLRSLQANDQRAKFKCLANNSYGAHQLETELRLDSWWPIQRSIELRPRLEFIQDPQQQELVGGAMRGDRTTSNGGGPNAAEFGGAGSSGGGRTLTLNCTIRMTSQPLVAIEWLKNGHQLFSVALASFAQLERATESELSLLGPFSGGIIGVGQSSTNNNNSGSSYHRHAGSHLASIFDQPSEQELILIEHLGRIQQQQQQSSIHGGSDQLDRQTNTPPDLIQFNANEFQAAASESISSNGNTADQLQVITTSSTLEKLSQISSDRHYQQQQQQAARSRIWHSLRLLQVDQLLYQLNFNSLRRSDRGSYQCRTKSIQLPGSAVASTSSVSLKQVTILQQTSQLLLKDTPPKFIETFSSALIEDHTRQQQQQQQQAVSLKCVASGSPLPEISWQLSGFQVPESSRFRVGDYVTRDGLIVSFVNITSVQPEDGGLYECSAGNDVGQLRHSAWLNVTGPAHIRPMPNVSAIAGGSLTIMCPVGGWPIEQIGWFQNSTKLPSNHRQKVFPNGTLVISELNEITDSGQYACQAKSAGSDHFALQQVHVSIKVPPVVEPFMFAKSLHRGQRYNIMCMVTRGDLPVSIRWFKDGQPIETAGAFIQAPIDDLIAQQQQQQQQLEAATASSQNYGLAIKQLDPYSSTLTFASLQSRHRGVYSCEAVNEVGRANQSSSLVIHVPPEWRIEPNDLSVTIGRTAVLDCQADGFPAARVEWRLSQDLYREPPSEFKPIISSLYMRVFENGSLIIYNTQRTDAGYYLCQANNGIGPGISKVIKLTVHVAAHFKSKIRTELVRRGQAARLKCEAFGDLPIEISWLKDKLPLYGQEEPRYSLISTQLQDGILSELVIHETTRTDSALFTCITQNQFGNDDTNIQLMVQGPPDPPEEVRIQEYEARSAKVSWLPGHSGNSPISKYILMYAPIVGQQPTSPTNTDYRDYPLSTNGQQQQQQQQQQQFQWTNVTIPGNESSHLLQGLVPLTEYHCYLIAINSIGASRPSNEPIKFRTDDEAPSLPPVFVKAQAISSRSIRVRWRAPERRRDQHYGLIAGFYVGYKLYRPTTTTGAAATTTTTTTTTGIQNNENQQQQQRASGGVSSPDSDPTISSGRVGSSLMPTGLTAPQVASNHHQSKQQQQETFVYKTIEFNQRLAVSGESQLATAATIETQLGNTGMPMANNNSNTKSSFSLDHECLLSSLKRGQKYLITVQPFNGRGAGPASEPVLAETWRVDVPDAPSLRMIARTTHSIHLAWRLPQTAVVSQHHHHQQQQQAKLTPSAFKAAVAAAQSSQLQKSGGQFGDDTSGQTRFVQMQQQQQQHQQQQQQQPASRLEELLQMSPEELAAEEAQANEPILGFVLTRRQLSNSADQQQQQMTTTTMAAQAQQQSTLSIDQQPAVELRLPSDHLTHIVDNLTCGTRYQFTIAAINSVGVSPASEPLVVKTEGSAPVAPDRNSLLSVNASSVVINLGAWHNGACSMRSFDVLFKPSRSKKWTTLTNYQFGTSANGQDQQQQQQDSQQQQRQASSVTNKDTSGLLPDSHSPRSLTNSSPDREQGSLSSRSFNHSDTNQMAQRSSNTLASGSPLKYDLQPDNGTIVLDDLVTSVNYDLKIVATNEAGKTEALYTFNTNGNFISSMDQQWSATGGEFQLSDANLNELFTTSGSIATLLPLLLLLLLVSLSLSTGCILFARRRRASSSNCSLSSSSRSNQSSSANYCGTTTTTTTSTSGATQGACRDQMLCGGGAGGGTLKGANATLMSNAGARRMLGLDQAQAGALLDDSPLLAAHHHHHQQQQQQQNSMRLNEIYGTHQRPSMQQQPLDKSHYAYLTAGRLPSSHLHHNRPSSPHNTDITSVLNGSEETEMCLGASALNLSGTAAASQQQQLQANQHESEPISPMPANVLHQFYNSNTLNHSKQGGQGLVGPNNYHQHQHQQQAYHLNGQLASGKLANQLMSQLGKSSTLPSNCHQQQMIQKLMAAQQQQQQQQTTDPSQEHQSMLDSFMAANLLQQQQQQQQQQDLSATGCQELSQEANSQQQVAEAAAAAYALQAAIQAASNGSQQQSFDQTMMSEALNLANMNMLDPNQQQQHHHHQQVYATVKRGCPRPPNNLPQHYTGTIYQCPGAEMGQHQQHDSQLLSGTGCCSGQASSSGIGSDGHQTTSVMYCYNQSAASQPHQDPTTGCLGNSQQQQQQQQQQQSDYQQLRSIN